MGLGGLRDPKKDVSMSFFVGICLPYGSFIIRGFVWEIPILSFAHVLSWGPRFCSGLQGLGVYGSET